MLAAYLTAVGGLAVGVALLSRYQRDLPVTEPLVALGVGVALGPEGLGLLALPMARDPLLSATAEILLALTVMSIALRYPWPQVRERARSAGILLVLALPGMAAVTALLAWWLLDIAFSHAWLLGAILAPTDPVLASTAVTGEPAEHELPARLRQLLSLESGANDGFALLLVSVGVVITTDKAASWWLVDSLVATVAAIPLGIAFGTLGGVALRAVRERGHQAPGTFTLFTPAIGLFSLGVAELLHLDAILVVFVAGLGYSAVIGEDERRPQSTLEEGIDRILLLPVFVFLGVALPLGDWQVLGWSLVAYVATVLLLRRLPVVLAIRRLVPISTRDALWLGWFGPIGVAALFYVTHSAELDAVTPTVWAAASAVIAVSAAVHALTSIPGRRLHAAGRSRRGERDAEPDLPDTGAAPG